METQIHMDQKLAILFIFFAGIGFSSSSVVESYESKSDTVCSFKKYIMKSYFKKYQCLIDSNFQDFITHELPFTMCEVLPDNLNHDIRLWVLERRLIGEGSHRRLCSSIGIHIKPESLSQVPIHFCEVIVVERLPSGVFADPFELQHLHQRGVFADIAVFGDTNLELPSFLSNRSVVEIHMDIGSNVLLRDNNELKINIELPLHARYPPLDESSYSRVEFGEPDLFMHCSIEAKLHNQVCLFISTSDKAESKTGAVVWQIPSGMKAHSGVVSVFTFISAILSTLLIVLASLFCSDINFCKNLKQS